MENPTMATTEVKTETKTDTQATTPHPHADLLAELEKFGVKNAEQLQGKLAASQQVGTMGNVLGEVRKENEELKKFIKDQMSQQHQPKADPNAGWETSNQNAGSIDLADLIDSKVKTGIRSVIQEEKQQAAAQQQRAWAAWNAITGDEDYPLVKEKWESKLKDPNFALQFQAGAIDPIKEYQELVRDTYKAALRKSAEVIKGMSTGVASPTVHVEGQARMASGKTVETPEKEKTLNPLREKINKGKILSEEEELAALMKVLGGGG